MQSQLSDMSLSQTSLDHSVVIAPPEVQKSSFPSPRNRHSKTLAQTSSVSDVDQKETIEQKYLKKKIEDRRQQAPSILSKEEQMRTIISKTKEPQLPENENYRISHMVAEEEEKLRKEDEQANKKKNMTDSESGLSLVLERGVPWSNSNVQYDTVKDDSREVRNSRLGSRDSDFSDYRKIRSDSQDSSRNEILFGMKGKADYKAMKKIEWLENYVEFRSKQENPMDSPDLERYKKVISKLNDSTTGSSENDGNLKAPAANIASTILTASAPAAATVNLPGPKLEQEVKLDDENDIEDVSSLKKQLSDAKREIEKLRLERALLHAKNEIKRLKTEITYGHEGENDETNVDKIFGETKELSPVVVAPSPLALTPTAVVHKELNKVALPADKVPEGVASPMSTRANRKSMRLNGQMGGLSKWSKIAKDVSTLGAEALVEESELELYKEEKRKRKKKKKFLEEIEEHVGFKDINRKKVNPLVLKQIQSFEFLSFLDSLEGLDGNVPPKRGELAPLK